MNTQLTQQQLQQFKTMQDQMAKMQQQLNAYQTKETSDKRAELIKEFAGYGLCAETSSKLATAFMTDIKPTTQVLVRKGLSTLSSNIKQSQQDLAKVKLSTERRRAAIQAEKDEIKDCFATCQYGMEGSPNISYDLEGSDLIAEKARMMKANQ